jgi:hypothetical protein
MMGMADQRWQYFDGLGIETVRKYLADHVFGEEVESHAREWLTHQESERTFVASRKALEASETAVEEARTANALRTYLTRQYHV